MTEADITNLIRPGDSIEYRALVSTCGEHNKSQRLFAVVRRADEAAILLVNINASVMRVEAALCIYKDLTTDTTQTQDGFRCDFELSKSGQGETVSAAIKDIRVLHDLLHVVKKYVAQADDLHQHSTGRSHQWVDTYRPLKASLTSGNSAGRDVPISDSTQYASPSASSSLFGSSFNSNVETPTSGHEQEGKSKDEHMHAILQQRKAEYAETQSITIKCSTWNMAGKDISESLITLLRDSTEDSTTIYCTAFQEVDLSAEAYLTTTDTRAQNYQAHVEGAIGDYYELIASHQLVGMLLCVYAHKSIVPTVSNVLKSYVPCGILGMIGNKGAVGIKFDVMNTNFAVLNCHLAAGQGGADKRNSDLNDIFKRIFNDSGVWDSGLDGIDNVIVMGDLNYRLDATRSHVDSMLRAKDLNTLLEADQLSEQRRRGRILADWEEGPITFAPTYKFDVGTDLYDSSEKQRIPSWTDRILIRSSHHNMSLVEDSYKSVPEYYQSDHKPVVAKFRADVEVILPDKQKQIRDEVYKKFDKHENDSIPSVKVKAGEDELDFGKVHYLQPVSKTFSIHNPGRSIASFSFSQNSAGQICKSWFWPMPSCGFLRPDESTTIQVTACVESEDAVVLNAGHEKFHDVLVLHVEGGTDTYISLDGAWQSTCIGQSLEVLSARSAVRETCPESHVNSEAASIPKVIYRICEYLSSIEDLSVPLFTRLASKRRLETLQECLDTNREFEFNEVDAQDDTIALCNLLVTILSTLTRPIVTGALYHEIMQGVSTMTVLDGMDGIDLNVLIYLRGFLSTCIARFSAADYKLPERICRVFGDALVRKTQALATPITRVKRKQGLTHEQEADKRREFMRALLE